MSSAASPAAACGAACGVLVVFRDDKDVEPAERLRIRGESAVRGGDENAPQLFAVAGAHLDDVRAEGACGAVGALDQFEARGQIEIKAAERHRVKIGQGRILKSMNRLLGRTGGDQSGGLGGVEQPFRAEIVGVGVACALAGENANSAAGAGSLAGGLDDLLVDAQRSRRNRLKIKIGVVAASGKASPRQRSSRLSVMPNFSKK